MQLHTHRHTLTHTRTHTTSSRSSQAKALQIFSPHTHSNKEELSGRRGGGFGGRVSWNFSFSLCALSNEFNSMSFQSFAQWTTVNTRLFQGGTFYAIHSAGLPRLWLCHSPKRVKSDRPPTPLLPPSSPSPLPPYSASGNLAMYANCWRQRNDQKQNFLTLNELPDKGRGRSARGRESNSDALAVR